MRQNLIEILLFYRLKIERLHVFQENYEIFKPLKEGNVQNHEISIKKWDLFQIETDEAEILHTLRLLVYLSVAQVSASYLSIYFSKFQMNLAAQITVVCRHNQAHSYHYRKNFYSKK